MSQTILIEGNEDLKKVFSLNLNTFVGTEVIIRKNAEDAIALLNILPQISLIITRNNIGDEETAIRLHQYLRDNDLSIPLIVMGACPTLAGEVFCLQDPVDRDALIKQAATYLGVTLKDVANKVRPDFLPIGLHYFNDIQKTPCDVYIRIKKGPGDYQFVKRIHSKDIFDRDVIQKYADQGLKEFYIPRDYIQYFTTFVTNSIVEKLERADLNPEERILTNANAHEIVRDSLQVLGFDEAMVDLSDASINSMVLSVKDSPQVGNLIKFLFSNKVSYAYQQCHLLALMCHYVLSKQSWYRDDHLHVLSFVSFFSDITLKSNQQMRISSMRELADSDFTDEERNQVLTHARDAHEILEKHPDATEYVKTVLLQSHGKLDGVGFEENPGEELHPLSKVFIISDCFVKILLDPSQPSLKKDILPLLYSRFTNPSYQKIIKALEQRFDA